MKKLSIRAARNDAQLTQEQSAKALGISRNTYASYENGNTKPTLEMASNIASLFGRGLDEIRFNQ